MTHQPAGFMHIYWFGVKFSSLGAQFPFTFVWGGEGGMLEAFEKQPFLKPPVSSWMVQSNFSTSVGVCKWKGLKNKAVAATQVCVPSHLGKLGLRASLAPSAPPSLFVSSFAVWLLYIWTALWPVSWTMKAQSFDIVFPSHVHEGFYITPTLSSKPDFQYPSALMTML